MNNRLILLVIAAFYLTLAAILPEACAKEDSSGKDENWSVIPEGAKSSYMGIHGGTMPVSLLVAGDGSSLLSFVGRTGDDFMETLRKAHIHLPSFGNSTKTASGSRASQNVLFAGNATASLPVFSIAGAMQGRLDAVRNLMPFGLSQEPLPIEGPVARPDNFPHARTIRPFRIPDYFSPRKR